MAAVSTADAFELSERCEGGDLNPYANYGASTSSMVAGPAAGQGREIASPPSPSRSPRYAREPVCNDGCNEDEDALRAEIERLQEQLAALRPPLRRVK